jgi:hypothetical protein
MNEKNFNGELKPEYDLKNMKVRKVGKGRETLQMTKDDEMLPEYNFDYSKSKPNRFAGEYWKIKKK